MRNYDYNEMINRLKAETSVQNFSIKKLSSIANVPYGTLYKVFSGETKEPSINLIIKTANALNVSADYLIFGEDKKTHGLNETEKKLISTFRELNNQGQKKIIAYAEDISSTDKYKKYENTEKFIG